MSSVTSMSLGRMIAGRAPYEVYEESRFRLPEESTYHTLSALPSYGERSHQPYGEPLNFAMRLTLPPELAVK